ncbi:flagellin [Aurantimonas sp. Leaf443]|uniref:flagellin n=1 Tax=Aurantimonas sp. Leaf443 TaxID=1736378 RepID=UPI0006F757F4|nr:flagellin [Aurantimonas sp. Leaf443]KQT87447.1 hypothetical protein ASG48_16755 [Aurantimonas sp. Leaf443]
MVSINSSATLAIRNLQSITKSLAETQDRMTTGFKVRSAKDNASVWQAATTLRSEIKTSSAMSTKLDAVKTAADVALVGIDTITETLGDIKSKVTAYSLEGDTGRKAVIALDIAALQKQIVTTIAAAEYNGANWLDGSATSISYSSTFEADGDEESTSFTLTDFEDKVTNSAIHDDADNTKDITTFVTTFTATDIAKVDGVTNINADIDTYIKAAKLYSAQISGLSSRITSQQDLLQKIADVKETALGSLVDADLEEEAAKAGLAAMPPVPNGAGGFRRFPGRRLPFLKKDAGRGGSFTGSFAFGRYGWTRRPQNSA